VLVAGSTLGAVAAADGHYRIEQVPAGTTTLSVRLLGYRATERTVRVRAGDTVRVDFTLRSEAQVLSTVRTSAIPTDVETFVTKPNVATVTLGADAIAGVPSLGEPDIVRTVQLLPGVVARNDFNTGLTVRGGEADQNLILMDGFPIYNPFHLGGLFSTFMDATVGGIELITGAFPSRYGGRLSSVLDVRSMTDTRPGVHATADLSAIAATARLAGAFAKGRGTWSLAARRTYADAVVTAFSDNVLPYHFQDFHAHATYALPGNWRLSVTGYGGQDVLDANFAALSTNADSIPSRAGEGGWRVDWGNHVFGASLSKEIAPNARPFGVRLAGGATVEQRVSTSNFSTRLNVADGAFGQRDEVEDFRVAGSIRARGLRHDPSVGYEIATHRVRYASDAAQTGTTDFDFTQRPTAGAVWVEDLWRLSSRFLVEGGVRAEALTGRDWAAVSPRLSLKYLATPNLAFTAGMGRATQWMNSLAGDGPLRYFEVWIASDSFTPVATAWHWLAGAERRIPDGSMRVEGFVKRYDRVMEANWSEDPAVRGDELFVDKGLSYGVDFIARRQPKTGVGGWISYTYGVASRTRDGVTWAPGHDRRHDLNVVAMWRVSAYRLGARFGYATGTPYTRIVGQIARRVYDPSRDRWGTGDVPINIEPLGGPLNGERFPASHRLDLDVSREFRVGSGTVAPYLSVVNAYNAKNIFIYRYDYSTDEPTRKAYSQFPIVPSLGVRVAF
jgi:carboxypeptidase family protein/TonB-dependent receptor-like protein